MTITLFVPKTESAVALRLRPWRLDDLPALLTAHRDPVLRRWLATSLADETDAQQWLDAQAASWASTTRFSFAVVADEVGNPPIGHVAVKVGIAGVAEVGYWTAAAVRGQGIAARALEHCVAMGTGHAEPGPADPLGFAACEGQPSLLPCGGEVRLPPARPATDRTSRLPGQRTPTCAHTLGKLTRHEGAHGTARHRVDANALFCRIARVLRWDLHSGHQRHVR